MEDIFAQEDTCAPAADDLPPPDYRPAAETSPLMDEAEDGRERFVAPRGPSFGQPSADTMARLQAAVGRTPLPRELPQTDAALPESAKSQETERPRFGINSLINRMTGTGETTTPPARPARQQPALKTNNSTQELQEQDEDSQIEIPAFLRRQAN